MVRLFGSMLIGWQGEWVSASMRLYRGLRQLRVLREHFRHIVQNFNEARRRLGRERDRLRERGEAVELTREDLAVVESRHRAQWHRWQKQQKLAARMRLEAEGGILAAEEEFRHWREEVAVLSSDISSVAELAGIRQGGWAHKGRVDQ